MAIEEGWTKQLAYFGHIAMLTGNRTIFNYTSRKLAKKLGKSHGTVNTHVQFLIEKGLLFIEYGNLKCISKKDMQSLVSERNKKLTGKGFLKIKVHNKILHTEWNICARVVLNNLKRQKHVSRIKSEVNAICKKISSNSYITGKEYARYKKLKLSQTKTEKGTGENICFLSDGAISKLLKGRSISAVRSMVDFWVEQGLISCDLVKGRVLDTHMSTQSWLALKDSRVGFQSTYLYRGRIIEFNKRSLSFGLSIKPRGSESNNPKHAPISDRTFRKSIDIANKLGLDKSSCI